MGERSPELKYAWTLGYLAYGIIHRGGKATNNATNRSPHLVLITDLQAGITSRSIMPGLTPQSNF